MAHALLIPFLIEYKFRPQQQQPASIPQVTFCAAQGAYYLSVGPGNTYQWFKDDVAYRGYQSKLPNKRCR
jgi:hypothetical protein